MSTHRVSSFEIVIKIFSVHSKLVYGKTIDRLRQDLTVVNEELRQLRRDVAELEKRTKMIETLDSEEFLLFVRSLSKKNDQ